MAAPQDQTFVSPFAPLSFPAPVKALLTAVLLSFLVLWSWALLPETELHSHDFVVVPAYWVAVCTHIFSRDA